MIRRDMLRSVAPLGVAVFGGLGLAACRDEPIHRTFNVSFVGRGNMRERSEQIRRAANGLGWRAREMRGGVIEAASAARGHNIVVNVTYDQRQFSISYVSSMGLNYDGQRIHTYYNGQVEALERAILRNSA